MLTLNAVVRTQMMPNTQVAQIRQLSQKTTQTRFGNRKLMLHDIAEELKMSDGSVFIILHEHLSMRKMCLKWVLRLLTVDQKQKCVDDSERCLQLLEHNKKEFLHKCVTMDETWIHYFTPESNWQSAEWTAAGESCPKSPKMQISASKVLVSVFWDVPCILFINYFEKGRNINSKYYIALLVCLKEEIAKRWPQMKKKCSLTKTMHNVTSWLQRW